MGFGIKHNIGDVRKGFVQPIIKKMGNTTPAMKMIGEYFLGRWQRFWAGERNPSGKAWAALSPVTISLRTKPSKKGRVHNPKILRSGRAGGLLQSYTYKSMSKAVWWGTTKIYAPTHQFGARRGQYGVGRYRTRRGSFDIPWGDIPARPMLPEAFSSIDWRTVKDIITNYVIKGTT